MYRCLVILFGNYRSGRYLYCLQVGRGLAAPLRALRAHCEARWEINFWTHSLNARSRASALAPALSLAFTLRLRRFSNPSAASVHRTLSHTFPTLAPRVGRASRQTHLDPLPLRPTPLLRMLVTGLGRVRKLLSQSAGTLRFAIHPLICLHIARLGLRTLPSPPLLHELRMTGRCHTDSSPVGEAIGLIGREPEKCVLLQIACSLADRQASTARS